MMRMPAEFKAGNVSMQVEFLDQTPFQAAYGTSFNHPYQPPGIICLETANLQNFRLNSVFRVACNIVNLLQVNPLRACSIDLGCNGVTAGWAGNNFTVNTAYVHEQFYATVKYSFSTRLVRSVGPLPEPRVPIWWLSSSRGGRLRRRCCVSPCKSRAHVPQHDILTSISNL